MSRFEWSNEVIKDIKRLQFFYKFGKDDRFWKIKHDAEEDKHLRLARLLPLPLYFLNPPVSNEKHKMHNHNLRARFFQ